MSIGEREMERALGRIRQVSALRLRAGTRRRIGPILVANLTVQQFWVVRLSWPATCGKAGTRGVERLRSTGMRKSPLEHDPEKLQTFRTRSGNETTD